MLFEQCITQKSLLYDKDGEEHYNIISALHKSMRNSDVQAAIYWFARMLEAGEDPLCIARRNTTNRQVKDKKPKFKNAWSK